MYKVVKSTLVYHQSLDAYRFIDKVVSSNIKTKSEASFLVAQFNSLEPSTAPDHVLLVVFDVCLQSDKLPFSQLRTF